MHPPSDLRHVRRNGQLSSCEPCRKSKLRCDHSKPVCSRCTRRGKPHLCLYHPAPMTGLVQKATRSPSQNDGLDQTSTYPAVIEAQPRNTTNSADMNRGTGASSMATSTLLSPFAEQYRATSKVSSVTTLSLDGVVHSEVSIRATPSQIRGGIDVLRLICTVMPQLAHIRDWPRESLGDPSGSGFLLMICWSAVKEYFQGLYTNEPSEDVLHKISTDAFEATSWPLYLPPDLSHSGLVHILSGPNLRWETVGICCAFMGMVFSASHSYGQESSQASKLMRQLLSASIDCRRFCESMSQVNDIIAWLLASATHLSTWSHGDDSYLTWHLMGDLWSTISALGITTASGGKPSYLGELRRRLCATSFDLDKVISTFTSRPPRISRRYCLLELPLDLPDDALTGPPEAFLQHVQALDKHGWNTSGVPMPVSRLRAATMVSQLRDAVLELSFEVVSHDIEPRIHELLQASSRLGNQLPLFMRYTDDVFERLHEDNADVIINIRLEHLYTNFLLYKLLVQQRNTHHSQFLEASHEIVRIVISVMKRPNVKPVLIVDVEWMTISYAMPCATGLVLVLLRQLHRPQQDLTINRSTIIRDLTVFISCCDWMTQFERGNHLLCKKAQGVLSRSLDFILAYPGDSVNSHSSVPPANDAVGKDPALSSSGYPDLDPRSIMEQDPELEAWVGSFGLMPDAWFQ